MAGMTPPAQTFFLPRRAFIVLRLGASATVLALLGGLLVVAFLQSSLQLGPDQLGDLAVAMLFLVPLVLILDLVIGVFFILPLYRDLRPIENNELVATEQAVKVWERLHRFPRNAMVVSSLMWIGWTAIIGWWLARRDSIGADEALLVIPACALLGITNAVGFYFRARAILRPMLRSIGSYLPPEFDPLRMFLIKRKLAMGFVFILTPLALCLGVEIIFWHQRGTTEIALALARDQMDLLAAHASEPEPPDAAAVLTGGVTVRPFLLTTEGNPYAGSLEPQELALLASSPRLLGFRSWREKRWLEAATAAYVGRLLPMPEYDFLRESGDGRDSLVVLARQPLRGGFRVGAIIDWPDEKMTMAGMEPLSLAIIVVFFAAIFLVAGLWTYWVAGDVIAPVQDLTMVISRGVENSSPGRATLISDDEIGRLGASFNRMSVVLSREMNEGRRLLEAVRGAMGKIAEIMRTIVDVSSDQAAGATEQAASLHQVTTTSEEIAVTLRSIAEHSRTVEEVAGRSLSSCHDGQTNLDAVASGMEAAQKRSHDVADKMISFQEHANRIENILEFIREVSERINLISLNASIEASSAGETGSRFAIIASEMRKLAEKTMNGTKEIRAIFSDLQSAASSAIIATEEGEKQVVNARRLNEQASTSFQSIIHWAGETARAAQEISLSSAQQTTATDHLASALSEINDVASNFAEGAKALENSVADLEKIGEELNHLLTNSRQSGGMG